MSSYLTESHGFLNTLLFTTVIGGILTVGVAILLAAWLSRRVISACDGLDGSDSGNCSGGYDSAASEILR